MRFEVKGFGVDVVCIEPGLIVTGFGDAAVSSLDDGAADEGPYAQVQRDGRQGDRRRSTRGRCAGSAAGPTRSPR